MCAQSRCRCQQQEGDEADALLRREQLDARHAGGVTLALGPREAPLHRRSLSKRQRARELDPAVRVRLLEVEAKDGLKQWSPAAHGQRALCNTAPLVVKTKPSDRSRVQAIAFTLALCGQDPKPCRRTGRGVGALVPERCLERLERAGREEARCDGRCRGQSEVAQDVDRG